MYNNMRKALDKMDGDMDKLLACKEVSGLGVMSGVWVVVLDGCTVLSTSVGVVYVLVC